MTARFSDLARRRRTTEESGPFIQGSEIGTLARREIGEIAHVRATIGRGSLPSLLTFELRDWDQSFGLGPWAFPPPLQRGDLMDPALARPVPFCCHGFLPPPRTSDRVFTLTVPWRQFALCHTTTR